MGVLVDISDHVAHVRLDRADKRNGLDLAMFEALVDAGVRLASDRGVRAIVLSGEGPSFCAGLDFASFMTMGDADRKSTRLNSSHVEISYAVFCLKKKKKIIR